MEWDWLSFLALVGLCGGHTALVIGAANRLHGLPFRWNTLRITRAVHDMFLVAFPAGLFWFSGVNGPRILWGRNWSQLPPWLLGYLGACAIAAMAVPLIAIRRGTARRLDALISNHSQTRDIAHELGHRPVGDGRHRWLARLPGNELFQVQVSEKSYRVPGLPAEWDSLSVLHVSDFHLSGTPDVEYFERLMKLGSDLRPDLVAFTGDLLDREDLLGWLPHTLGRITAPLGCYFVLGNHDWYLGRVEETRRTLRDLGWCDVAGRCITRDVHGHLLAIGGSERPWMGSHPDFDVAPADALRLLLSHTPDNISWARRQRVDLMLAGHNHGGQVRLPIFGPVFSPSVFGCRYASGVFWEPPTLLYVNRGISGVHPWRWRCPPELTKLVLRQSSNATLMTGQHSDTER
jgi:predicted MPP superfamily phosphohydrolase